MSEMPWAIILNFTLIVEYTTIILFPTSLGIQLYWNTLVEITHNHLSPKTCPWCYFVTMWHHDKNEKGRVETKER